MFSMILKRMEWMDEKGIQQWNAAKYDTIYPLSYYEEKRLNGEVFVLVSKDTKELISAAVLKEQDDRWNDSEPALYLHNFVTRVEAPGAGSIFLRFAEEYALKKGKKYLRLDSAADNPSLARYYTSQGFVPAGTCTEGGYNGILRQKNCFPEESLLGNLWHMEVRQKQKGYLNNANGI